MIAVNFSEQELQNILALMQRVTMNGKEAFAYVALINKIVESINASQQGEKADAAE